MKNITVPYRIKLNSLSHIIAKWLMNWNSYSIHPNISYFLLELVEGTWRFFLQNYYVVPDQIDKFQVYIPLLNNTNIIILELIPFTSWSSCHQTTTSFLITVARIISARLLLLNTSLDTVLRIHKLFILMYCVEINRTINTQYSEVHTHIHLKSTRGNWCTSHSIIVRTLNVNIQI